MHTESNGHSHLYVLCSSKPLAVKTHHNPRRKGSIPFAQVCACRFASHSRKAAGYGENNTPRAPITGKSLDINLI